VAYTEDSTKMFFPQKITGVGYTGKSGLLGVGYTGESGLLGVGYTAGSGLTGVGYTGESRLPGVAYTGESLVQPSMPANALKGTVPEKIIL
jgi:hypothetical protein